VLGSTSLTCTHLLFARNDTVPILMWCVVWYVLWRVPSDFSYDIKCHVNPWQQSASCSHEPSSSSSLSSSRLCSNHAVYFLSMHFPMCRLPEGLVSVIKYCVMRGTLSSARSHSTVYVILTTKNCILTVTVSTENWSVFCLVTDGRVSADGKRTAFSGTRLPAAASARLPRNQRSRH